MMAFYPRQVSLLELQPRVLLRETIILSGLAGLVAGALSMAAGEYVPVSSQSDIEKADLAREKKELEVMPEGEIQELADIYVNRGLDKKWHLRLHEN